MEQPFAEALKFVFVYIIERAAWVSGADSRETPEVGGGNGDSSESATATFGQAKGEHY